jgi:arylsulfatase A-like enzyme
LAALLGLAACAPPATTTLRYEDLVIEGRLASSLGTQPQGEAFCADENRWSLGLRPAEELAAALELGEGARLVIAGCAGPLSRDPGTEGPAAGGLEIEVASGNGGEALAQEIRLPTRSEAFRQEIDLGRLARGPVSIALRARLPAGRQLYLREVYLRHRVRQAPRRREEEPPTEPARQVLLVSVDTLRRDALSALGGPWPTPALDRFVSRAQLFDPHYAAAPWTKPSHGSLLTGQSPRVHGAEGFEAPLTPAVPLLAERFQAAGFLTQGLVFDCLWLNPKFGFHRGFAGYRSEHWTLPQMARQTVDWIADHRDRSFFYFLHTFEPHSDFHWLPYEAPEVRRRTVYRRFGVPNYGRRGEQLASGMLVGIKEGRIAPLPGEDGILRFLYGEGVRHVDRELGMLFADLEELGLFDRMMIVVTSDHGEALLEHGETLHGSPWSEVARVPLAIKWPGGRSAGLRAGTPTSALDVAPTILAAMGLPREGLPGRDLARLDGARPVFSWGNWRMVVRGEVKAVFRPAGQGDLLFDLAADPREERNLAAERPDLLAELRLLADARSEADRRLAAELESLEAIERERPLTPEELERLRALGYVGGAQQSDR